jgi:CRP/FNR family transcriptional regulator
MFRAVDQVGHDQLHAMAQIRRYAADEIIFQQGDPCPGLFLVMQGQVRIFKLNPAGKKHVLHFADPGQTFAEVAVLGGFNVPASAEAATNSTCLLLPNAQLIQALHDNHALSLQMMRGMAVWVRSLVDLLEGVTLRDAAGRLAQFLLNQANDGQTKIALQSLKRDLADHLNLTSETLSRTLRRLETDQLIDRPDSKHVRLLDRPGLQRLAEGLSPD